MNADMLRTSADDALDLLHFAASFLWADMTIAPAERAFLEELARELRVPDPAAVVAPLLTRPPAPEIVDPSRVRPALAERVREVALRAIAADGAVEERELELFDVLDDLLPGRPRAA